MWQGSLSLQGTLFIQAFKSFVDGDLDSAAKLVPLLTLKFQELEMVLRHDNKQQLLDFLEFLKKKAEERKEQQQQNKLKDIDLVLYNIRQSLQPKKESYEQLLAKGKQALKDHKEGQALAFFNLALAEKETQEVLLCLANVQLNYYQQIKEFKAIIERAMRCEPNELVLPAYEALISQMQCQIEVDLNLRFRVIRRAVSLRSKDPNVYLELAIVGLKLHMKLGEYQTVVQENCPDSIEKPFAIGVINYSEKYWSKAEKMFQACQEKIQTNNKNRLLAERKLRKNGDDSLFKKVSNFKKQDDLYYFLGKVNERLKAGREVQMYEKGLKYNPTNIQIWKQMIRLIQKQPGRQAQLLCIIQHLNSFAEFVFSIRDSSINENIIELLFESGQKQALIQYALGLVASFPDLDLAYYLVAKVYYKVGQYQKCKEYCQKCLKLNGKNQGVFFFLGKIAFDQQRNDDAREYYNKATQLNPKQYLAHFNLGILEYKLGRYQEAANALEFAIACATDFSPAYELLIHAYMKQGKFQEARDIVVDLPQGENRSQSFLMDFFYAKISYQEEKDKEAEKHFKLVLEKQPEHWDSIYKLVVINITQLNRKDSSVLSESRSAQAQAYVAKLLNAPIVKGRYKAAKGYLLMQQNNPEEAIPMLMQAISQHKQQFQAYYHLGYALKDRITDIDNLSQELQDLIACNEANIESYYFSSLFYLGFKAFDYFLEKFNKYIRCPKVSESQSRRQTMRIYRNVITHLEHLRRFYPDDNDLILLLGILYRDVANRQKTLRYFSKLQSKLMVKQQADLLFNKFLRFYNQNGKYQQNSNYLQYIFQYIFLEVYEMDQMQGMMLYNYLIEGHDYFNSNEGIKFAIQERKREIVSMNLMHVVGRQIEELDGVWRKHILKGNHFLDGRKVMEVVPKEEQERYRRCLIYQFYCNKIYPYVYNDQKAIKSLQLCLQFLLNPQQPKETPQQLYELTRSKLNPILFTKAESSYQPYLSQNYKRYESNIYFAEFQTEQLSPFTFDCKHFELAFKKYRISAAPKSTIQPLRFQFKYLNSLQKKIMKKPPQTQSLIMIARSSIIARPKAQTSIYVDQQSQPFD